MRIIFLDFKKGAVLLIAAGLFFGCVERIATVNFHANGGRGSMQPVTAYEGSVVKLPNGAFTKDGHVFGGWAVTADGAAEYAGGSDFTLGTADVTLYAVWTLNSYAVTFNANAADAAGAMPPQAIVYGATATLDFNTFVRSGYLFAGWAASANAAAAEFADGAEFTMGAANAVLYAVWLKTLHEMVAIPAGSFKWTTAGELITLSRFWLSKKETTQEQWEEVMRGNANGIDLNPSYGDPNKPAPSPGWPKRDAAAGEAQARRPVESVNWYEAVVYCNRLSVKEGLTPAYAIEGRTNTDGWGTPPVTATDENKAKWDAVTVNGAANGYRLPTEAEWQYAAIGGNLTEEQTSLYQYAGSNSEDTVAWYNTNRTHEVGIKVPNGYGLYDMSGNVEEWCGDWWQDAKPEGVDPTGPLSGDRRIARGATFISSRNNLKLIKRDRIQNSEVPQKKDTYSRGFRVARRG